VPGVSVDVVDTTGAGDCFVGTLAAALARREPLRDAVTLAVRTSALSVTRRGTIPSLPRAQELFAS
jgi:ribokinase